MKKVRTEEAVGKTLCHDITKIVPGGFKGRAFKKGHIIQESDLEELLDCGKAHIYVWEHSDEVLHENDAAIRIARMLIGEGLSFTEPNQGKVNIVAEKKGMLKIDINKLKEINFIEQVAIATLHSNSLVNPHQVVAGTRVIPLVIEKGKIEAVEQLLHDPIIDLMSFSKLKYGIITTGSEVYSGRIEDAFGPVVKNKMSQYECELVDHIIVPDDKDIIKESISELIEVGVEAIFITGGMSVDPDDVTPAAIREWGAKIVTYGTPVLPGSMLLLAYYNDIPIIGLPGCVMYAQTTVFDLLLPRIIAGEVVTKKDIASLGHGGLCTECEHCTFPKCSFGKGG